MTAKPKAKSKYGTFLVILFVVILLLLAFRSCGSDTMNDDGAASIDLPDNVGEFTTTDLYGNEVTEAIFSEKEVTLVNVWGTYCLPCIAEIPDLREIDESLSDDAQIIGIVCDASNMKCEEYEDALKIVGEGDTKYVNLLYNKSMTFMDSISAIPTSFLVDSEGNIIGEPIIGRQAEAYKEALADYMK